MSDKTGNWNWIARLGWFIGLWVASVLVVTLVAYAIRGMIFA